ncbi:MAG TPA: DEAD/DEAH box helicase [Acidimicrobiales bacterium]|nr:DEAD/DEAH box helicase [Acidimicrobiales bacterium]
MSAFHPAVAEWFHRRFPAGPSEPQVEGWPLIRSGSDVLIAAPTGSGKTLTGFLVAIDALYRAHAAGEAVGGGARVVYVSPLKALAVDVHQNLERPLAEIAAVAAELGLSAPELTIGVRTGDTPASARTAMVAKPPTFLVTTPESLYLLVTAGKSREMLGSVETVIVDEIHAMARDKRGSHLSLTLERLDHVQLGARRPQRIGLSATQRPIERVAELLTGDPRRPEAKPTAIVDCGHRRDLRISIEVPGSELGAVASTEQFGEVIDQIAEHVRRHRTTLVFVNTRRMSERLAHLLAERLGADDVAAHHGSLSKERRLRVEERLRAGELRALVATASLELGIDIGPVELVCQVGSPRSIATMLQRAGRSNHSLAGVPEAIVFPLTRDELVECAALLASVRAGDLDATVMPESPLDILAQQVVAEVAAAEEWREDDLFDLFRRATPFARLERADFDSVVQLLSEGIETGRGQRMAYLHRDRVNGVVRPRRGARLAALTSGGAIAEVGDYRVLAAPGDTPVGTVNEDFAIESMVGDVFLLGTHSWRVRRVEQGVVRVTDAEGMHPTIPFWIGEAPSRTRELSRSVSDLRGKVDQLLDGGGGALEGNPAVSPADGRRSARQYVTDTTGLGDGAAAQLVDYLAIGRAGLGVVPTQDDIVFERFFDEAGGMQLVVHAPFGGRINKAFGLALRKRFCATFDFELQAAANDDAVVLSLSPQHSFTLDSVPGYLRSASLETVLTQAVLTSPLFAARWRWNLNRALAVLRFRGGKRNPLPIQRMESDDLMAAVFPALAACQENVAPGPVVVPDHVLVRQTMSDCLHEAMDADGLVQVVKAMEEGAVRLHFVDSVEPSVLAHEILNGKPFTFLDDAPLEERRTRAVQLRRGLPLEQADLGRLDTDAVVRIRSEAAPEVRDQEELHDLLLSYVVTRPVPEWQPLFDRLVASGRAMVVDPAGSEVGGRWCALERRPWVEALVPGGRFRPDLALPPSLVSEGTDRPIDPDAAVATAVRGHLDVTGPITVSELEARLGLPITRVRVGLARAEAEGFALRGRFDPALSDDEQWCARRLLARIHASTHARLRREIEPVTPQELMRFLLEWQHVVPGTQVEGRAGLLSVVDQLQGFELAAGAWEESVFPARVTQYQGQWLQDLCLSGDVAWGRLSVRPSTEGEAPGRGASTPSRATPITFTVRDDLPWLLAAIRGKALPIDPVHGAAHDVLEVLRSRGALFHSELRASTGRLPVEVEEGLWDLVARGLVTSDGFQAVRSLWSARETWRRRHRNDARSRLGSQRAQSLRAGGEGRWALLPGADGLEEAPPPAGGLDPDGLAENVAAQLLTRWGVVFWDLMVRESLAVPWREVMWALRRFEARGLVRGGRFVTGFSGEQYALPEAVDHLRRVRRAGCTGGLVRLNAADPLNLVGTVVAGDRIPAVRNRWVAYRDGAPLGDESVTDARRPLPAIGR